MNNLDQVAADIAARIKAPQHYDAILTALRDAERVAARRRRIGFAVLACLLCWLLTALITLGPQ